MFHKGQQVIEHLIGAGFTTTAIFTVLKVSKGEVWLDNDSGNDPNGPFDVETGQYAGFCVPGFSKRITQGEDAT